MSDEEHIPLGAVAIVGMAGRFPGAPDLNTFWQNLAAGEETISTFSDEELLAAGVDPAMLANPRYVKAGGILADADKFPAEFFGFTPREAEIMAPQHRLFLECAWEAIEQAGYVGETYPDKIGVFGGMNFNNYLLNNLYSNGDLVETVGPYQLSLSNAEAFLCTRTSYKLNLKGPSVTVQTACSTSLVAVCQAYFSLLNYQSDMALAGGVTVWSPQKVGYLYQPGGLHSPDGHTRTFDARAEGSVGGNGVGLVLLKRLEDALADRDHVLAVIRGAATNNDGAMKVGYTAPSVEAQAEVILMAQALADVDIDSVGYVEAHGTATALGDPVEVAALTRAFRQSTERSGYCALGAVKTNIGHLDSAAGIAGLIKTVLALQHKQIPPSLHYNEPNPQIDFASSPFFVNTALREWPSNGAPRRAGVNSLGLGGTNAHVILEEMPERPPLPARRPCYPLVLSAQTPTALDAATTRLVEHLAAYPDLSLADVAHTLMVGRKTFHQRRAVIARDVQEAIDLLKVQSEQREVQQPDRPVVFMFPAQDALYPDMGRTLYETEPLFRETIDRCAAFLDRTEELPLKDLLYPAEEQVEHARSLLAQKWAALPALFSVSYALAQLWQAWGVKPQALMGESLGEWVAACVAEVFELEEALALVTLLGRLLDEAPDGERLAVTLAPAELQPLLADRLSLVSMRTPTSCVVSGPTEAILSLEAELSDKEIEVARQQVDDGIHSQRMAAIIARFMERVETVTLRPPQLPILSNVSGSWLTDEEAQDPAYWATHLQQPVRLAENLSMLAELSDWLLLEVGPGTTLTSLARRSNEAQAVVPSLAPTGDDEYRRFLDAWRQLWLHGVQLDQEQFFAHEPRYRVPLPTYPLERKRYWIEPQHRDRPAAKAPSLDEQELDVPGDYPDAPRNRVEQFLAKLWSQMLGISQIGIHDNFFHLGGTSLMVLQLVGQLQQAGFDLTAEQFLEHQTIARLAAFIAPDEEDVTPAGADDATAVAMSPRREAACLQQGEADLPPLFLIPPANANLFAYRRLVDYLAEPARPVYALAAFYEQIINSQTLAEVAAEYLDVIQSIQPHGPYFIAGWSAGGPFAFEVAQQIRHRQESVAMVSIIDSSMGKDSLAFVQLTQGLVQGSPFFARLYRSGRPGQRLLQLFARALLRYRKDEVQKRMERHNRAAVLMIYVAWLEDSHGVSLEVTTEDLLPLSFADQIAYLQQQAHLKEIRVEEEIWQNIRQWVEMTLQMSNLIDDHQPERFPGTVNYIRAIEPIPDQPELEWVGYSDETRGVAAFCSQISLYRVAGNHFTMMDEPYVQIAAKKLQQIVRQADEQWAWEVGTPEPGPDAGSPLLPLLLLLVAAGTLLALAFHFVW